VIVIDFEGQIKGNCSEAGHEKWVILDSIQLGVGRSISTLGGGADRDTSQPSFSELTCAKSSDISSTDIFGQSIYGVKLCDKAIVHFLQTGGDADGGGQIYMELELHEPIISSYSVSSGGERPSESFSVSFTRILMKYTEFTSGGKETKADDKGWDLMAAKKLP